MAVIPKIVRKAPVVTRCPTDVKRCPDGSFVGRDPALGCAFRPCPTKVAPVLGQKKITPVAVDTRLKDGAALSPANRAVLSSYYK